MSAHDDFMKKAQALKKETVEAKTEKAVKENKAVEVALKNLATVKGNPELSRMYRESASVGSENLAGSLPTLKVPAPGTSTKNELQNGEEPNDGYFFYKPTQEQFKDVIVHVLTISKGYRADDMNGKSKFNQILAGVIINEGAMKPFMMYFTGLKLKNLWEFGKEASKYTKNPSMPIPMFAMTVKLTTEKVSTDYGKSWIVNFEIVKNEDLTPVVVVDPIMFQNLRTGVARVQDSISSLIDSKSVTEPEEEPKTIVEPGKEENTEPVNPDQIPF